MFWAEVCLLQHPKVRNVFNLDFPDSNHLAKTLTIVSGPDTVNLTYHNFFASKEKVTQVMSFFVRWLFPVTFPVYSPPLTDPPWLSRQPQAISHYTMSLFFAL